MDGMDMDGMDGMDDLAEGTVAGSAGVPVVRQVDVVA